MDPAIAGGEESRVGSGRVRAGPGTEQTGVGRLRVLSLEVTPERSPAALLCSSGIETEVLHGLPEGIVRLAGGGIDAVIIDSEVESTSCLQALRFVREVTPGLPIIILCAEQEACGILGLQAIKLGAQEVLTPSDLEPGRLRRVLFHAIERNRKMDESRRLSFELETAIAKRNKELEQANHELETFNYTVSHDLRTPLSTIVSVSELLLEEHVDSFALEVRSLVERLVRAGRRMESLVDAFLDLARAGGSVLRPVALDLSALAHEVYSELERRSPHADVELRVQEEMWVDADQNLLEMILLNLLGNARKFSALGGGSPIELGCFDQAGEHVFFVKDHGLGFDPALSSLLFKPFARFETRSEGTGVGLATVERAVSRHGGRVWAEGRPGEGATFYFTLGKPDVSVSP